MRFTRVSDAAYARFINEQRKVSFTQLPEYVTTRRAEGYQVELVGVVDGDPERLVAAAAILFRPWRKVFKRASLVFGPTMETFDHEAYETFNEGLLAMLRADRRVLNLRWTPAVVRRHFDDITPFDETTSAQRLETILAGDYEPIEEEFGTHASMPMKFVYEKNIDGMSFKEIVASTGQQVRTAFNRWGTNGVEVRMMDPSEIDVLTQVLLHTSERTGTAAPSQATMTYYADLARQLGPDKAFLPVAVLHTAKYLEQIASERAEVDAKVAELREREQALAAEGKVFGKKQRNQLKEHESRLEVLDRREAETREVQETHGDEVVLSAAFFIRANDELTYLVAGSYEELVSYYGVYLIHRVMMEWAAENGIKYYNFYGISGDFSDDASDAGVLHFKRQFHGNAVEYVGTYETKLGGGLLDKLDNVIDAIDLTALGR